MQAAEQTTTTTPALMRFFGEQDKHAWINGRPIDQLELWEKACVECGYIPPATKAEFLAATKDDAAYPDLEAWRVDYQKGRFEKEVREKMEAAGMPAEAIDEAIAEIGVQLGAKMADVNVERVKVKMINLGKGGAEDLEGISPELLDALLGDDEPGPGRLLKLVKALVDVEKSREREACAKLVEAIDPEAGARFAAAIRFRDKEEKERAQCDCAKCTAKRARESAANQTTH